MSLFRSSSSTRCGVGACVGAVDQRMAVKFSLTFRRVAGFSEIPIDLISSPPAAEDRLVAGGKGVGAIGDLLGRKAA